jgi:Domain of unknown function (DUF1127)
MMALIQTDHDNVVQFIDAADSFGPARRPFTRWIAQACEHIVSTVQHRLANITRWFTRRRSRARLTMAERARQRRVLARLSDRELRDIGISRYDIEFVLRRSCWR